MGNDAIYAKLIEMQGDISVINEKLDAHLDYHKSQSADKKETGSRAWGFIEKVVMMLLSATVGAVTARLGIK